MSVIMTLRIALKALNRNKLESARWIIRNARLLPEWEKYEQDYLHPKTRTPASR